MKEFLKTSTGTGRKILAAAAFCLQITAVAQQWNGQTLYTGGANTYLMDTAGVPTKTWTTAFSSVYSNYMKVGGTILKTASGGVLISPTHGGMYGKLQMVDASNNLIWQWSCNSTTLGMHHDVAILPNGNILAIVAEKLSSAQYQAAGGTNSVIANFLSEKVIEIEPVGSNSANIVWEWKLWDHLVQNVDPNKPNYYPTIVDHPELMNINYQVQADLMHMNGIDYNPILDQIALSSRYKNEIYIIDHSTTTAEAAGHSGGYAGKGGDILYRWGNPPAYQAAGPKILGAPHDSHWVPADYPDAGMFVGLNVNGIPAPTKTAVDRVITPRAGYAYTITPGAAFTPTTFTKRYISPTLIGGYSNSVQFPNGNQMLCLNTYIYEVDSMGTLLWQKTLSGFSPQAHRYPPCYLTNSPSAQPSISVIGNLLTSTPGFSYQWYYNGDLLPGANSVTYTATQSGNFLVRVYDGCAYLYSSTLTHTLDLMTGLNEATQGRDFAEIFPNPSNGLIHIKTSETHFKVEVYAANGDLLATRKDETSLRLNQLETGIYYIRITNSRNQSTHKKITIIR